MTESEGYPAEKRVADLERFLAERNVRESALHHARESWGLDYGYRGDVHQHACEVITLAQAFERYLTDGTAHQKPTTSTTTEMTT